MKKIFLIFVIIITGTLLLSEEQKMEPLKEEIKKLLPPNSAICKCASFSNKPKVKIGKYKYPGPWYGNSIQELNEWGKNIKEQDCIIQSDVDDDGKKGRRRRGVFSDAAGVRCRAVPHFCRQGQTPARKNYSRCRSS